MLFYFQVYSEMIQFHIACILSCPTLCDPIDCSLPSSSVHGIFQARILEWVAISSSRGSSQPSDRTCVSGVSWGRQEKLQADISLLSH